MYLSKRYILTKIILYFDEIDFFIEKFLFAIKNVKISLNMTNNVVFHCVFSYF